MASESGAATGGAMAPDQALRTLLEGNARYAAGEAIHPNQSARRRAELAETQHPLAVILGCSDSRVPPVTIFDAGLGDLFVIRVVGDLADPLGIESIDYAVTHLATGLIVVLGHDRCGAVTAAVNHHDESSRGVMVNAIRPAVEIALKRPGEAISNAIDENVRLTVEKLRAAPEFADRVKAGTLKIVGARYNLATGKVGVFSF